MQYFMPEIEKHRARNGSPDVIYAIAPATHPLGESMGRQQYGQEGFEHYKKFHQAECAIRGDGGAPFAWGTMTPTFARNMLKHDPVHAEEWLNFRPEGAIKVLVMFDLQRWYFTAVPLGRQSD